MGFNRISPYTMIPFVGTIFNFQNMLYHYTYFGDTVIFPIGIAFFEKFIIEVLY